MISRAQPLLGTIVSVRAEASTGAINAALAAVECVHRLMSTQSGSGDLARIHSWAHAQPVQVHAWTYRVLACAETMSRASGGAFDITLGRGGASHADVILLSRHRVRLRRPIRLDLGGIAKGFAVDRAVDALVRSGASWGNVNAGGDLRIFGPVEQSVSVRVPARPYLSVPLATATERSFATSASYFGGQIMDSRRAIPVHEDYSITVVARSCMVADALTKIVTVRGPMREILRRFGASAYLLDASGTLHAARA